MPPLTGVTCNWPTASDHWWIKPFLCNSLIFDIYYKTKIEQLLLLTLITNHVFPSVLECHASVSQVVFIFHLEIGQAPTVFTDLLENGDVEWLKHRFFLSHNIVYIQRNIFLKWEISIHWKRTFWEAIIKTLRLILIIRLHRFNKKKKVFTNYIWINSPQK